MSAISMPLRDINRNDSDSALLERLRRGDDDAATELYVKYASRIQAVASSETCERLRSQLEPEDVVQSVFRTFFRRVSEGFFEIPPGDEIWNLILVIALNKIRRTARYYSRKKRDLKSKSPLDDLDSEIRDSDQVPLIALQMTIRELLDGAKPLQQKMIEMRIQGHELEEIAKQTHRSTRTIERVLKHFRDRLSRQINVA